MTTRKTWSVEEKLRIVMEGLEPQANVSEICRRHGISGTAYYAWRDRALAGMKAGLTNEEGSAETALRQQNGRLKKLVADLSIANDVLQEHLEGNGGKNVGGSS
jgi:transposase